MNRLQMTISVNSKTFPLGATGHMVNTCTQTRWNGIVGDLYLAAHNPVWIQQVRVAPDLSVKVSTVRNAGSISWKKRYISSQLPG